MKVFPRHPAVKHLGATVPTEELCVGAPRRSDPLTGARYAASTSGYIAGTTRTIRSLR